MIKAGETLELEMEKPGRKTVKYKCKVDKIDNGRIFVTYPTNLQTNKSEFFMIGSRFRASFTTSDKSTYAFSTEMVDRFKDRIPLLILSFPGEEGLEKVQRREFVRVDSAIDVAIHPTAHQFSPFTTLTSDISAGGCMINLPERHPLRNGQVIYCWMVIPLKQYTWYIKQKAMVLRILEGENGRLKAPLQFIDVTEKDKQNYLRFCFEEQLKFKKNGLI
ncbi:flagellar brake protein [Pseudalkalibacillus sp. SCS-8]|uniref:flagellar brake protein n=1 Tax=Pseudalkalibacillus nanhaiensis TaxID=3115291 RepID=UPI0032DA5696